MAVRIALLSVLALLAVLAPAGAVAMSPEAPEVAGIEPSFGPSVGGAWVSIRGEHLENLASST